MSRKFFSWFSLLIFLALIALMCIYSTGILNEEKTLHIRSSRVQVDGTHECKDKDAKCQQWSSEGWCDRCLSFMTANCSLSCGFCQETTGEESSRNEDYNSGFLVDTPTCRILDIDPFHSSIKQFVRKEESSVKCPVFLHGLTKLEGGKLTATEDLIKVANQVECFFETVDRKYEEPDDNNWRFGSKVSLPLVSGNYSEITEDFVRVTCNKKAGGLYYEEFLTQVSKIVSDRNKEAIKQQADVNTKTNSKENERHKIEENLNVILLGIDSMSRLNGHRQLTKVRNYMMDTLHGVELVGYNRVGDNTFLNVIPLLMGITIDETKWDASKSFDDSPFIWKKFINKGYVNLYSEDSTEGSIFNYVKKGFHKYPAHHYNRPFSLAMQKSPQYKPYPVYCCGAKPMHRYVVDYLKQFVLTYHKENIPFFGWSFITYLSHDSINDIGKGDGDYSDFIKTIHEAGALNNTLLVVFGDHGFRFGGIRGTYIGRYEENLPMIYMAFPEWFGKKYPTYMRNLIRNQKRLTTPFDVHETMRDLCTGCSFDPPHGDYGMSLLDSIPLNRTCAEAGIPVHYCACREEKQMSVEDENVRKASDTVITRINELNAEKKGLCHVLKYNATLSASTTVHDQKYSKGCTVLDVCYDSNWHKMDTTFHDYIITVRAQPGGGHFQATVRQENSKFAVLGDISRINLYGNTSACITDNFNLRKFCYCKNNPS